MQIRVKLFWFCIIAGVTFGIFWCVFVQRIYTSRIKIDVDVRNPDNAMFYAPDFKLMREYLTSGINTQKFQDDFNNAYSDLVLVNPDYKIFAQNDNDNETIDIVVRSYNRAQAKLIAESAAKYLSQNRDYYLPKTSFEIITLPESATTRIQFADSWSYRLFISVFFGLIVGFVAAIEWELQKKISK